MPDIDDFDDSFNTRMRETNTTTTTTSNTTFTADLDDVGNVDHSVNGSGNVSEEVSGSGNTDNSVNGSGNAALDLDNVGNVDSHDTASWTEGSYNDNSDNTMDDHSDNSVNDSNNSASFEFTSGSFNSYLDESMTDDSIHVGVREYNTGFGDVALGGGGGAGDVWVNNQNTIVDQSFNANVEGWDGVEGGTGSTAIVASGNGAMVAGNDLNLSQYSDRSTNISAQGDVNMNNTTDVVNVVDSYNSEVDSSSWTDSSMDVGIDDSFNDMSDSYTADNSFNEELMSQTENTWDIEADVIWGSEDSAVVEGDASVDMGYDS